VKLATYATGKIPRRRKPVQYRSGMVIVSALSLNGWYKKYKPVITIRYRSVEERSRIINNLVYIRNMIDNEVFVLSIMPDVSEQTELFYYSSKTHHT